MKINPPRYIDGRTNKKYYCIDCNKQIGVSSGFRGNGRCSSCHAKYRFVGKPENNNWFGVRRIGKENPCWNGGKTHIRKSIRGLSEYELWRNEVFKRDNYICQECDVRGGDLEAHHKKEFNKILQEFINKYNQFSPIEDKETLIRLAITYEPFWELSNGMTLCKECHKLTFIGEKNYG